MRTSPHDEDLSLGQRLGRTALVAVAPAALVAFGCAALGWFDVDWSFAWLFVIGIAVFRFAGDVVTWRAKRKVRSRAES